MNINRQDIDDSISFLLNLINNRSLDLDRDNIELFINFVYQEGYIMTFNDKILQYFHNKSKEELNELADEFRLHEELNVLMIESFHIRNRNELKKKLIEIEQKVEDDELITAAFELQNRREQKKILIDIENKPKKTKIKFLYLISSIAASITILLFITLQKNSLYMYDTAATEAYVSLAYTDITLTESEITYSGNTLRGDEYVINNYNQIETIKLLDAIEAVKNENYYHAKDIFNQFQISLEENPELSLFLCIAQLNTNDANQAIKNLEYLKKLNGFRYKDETKLNLAFAYIKNEEPKKAIPILKELVKNNKNKVSEIAYITLNKLEN
jgi:hypothetical protein